MSDEITLQERIKHVEAQLDTLSGTLSTLNKRVREWISKRDQLNQAKNHLRDDINQHKFKRNQSNEKVQKLKSFRVDLHNRLNAKQQDYHELHQQRTSLYNESNQSEAQILRQIERLEWKIQTKSHPVSHENELINQIKTLERQAAIHQKRSKYTDQMTQLRHTISEINLKILQLNHQISAHAKESQIHHATMNEKIGQLNQKRDEADQAHQHYLESMQKVQQHEAKYIILNNQLRELLKRVDFKRQEKLNTNLESQREIVITKMSGKKKVPFEEYKALKEKGII